MLRNVTIMFCLLSPSFSRRECSARRSSQRSRKFRRFRSQRTSHHISGCAIDSRRHRICCFVLWVREGVVGSVEEGCVCPSPACIFASPSWNLCWSCPVQPLVSMYASILVDTRARAQLIDRYRGRVHYTVARAPSQGVFPATCGTLDGFHVCDKENNISWYICVCV